MVILKKKHSDNDRSDDNVNNVNDNKFLSLQCENNNHGISHCKSAKIFENVFRQEMYKNGNCTTIVQCSYACTRVSKKHGPKVKQLFEMQIQSNKRTDFLDPQIVSLSIYGFL